MLIQKLFRLINLGREVRTSAAIGVVEQHQLTVFLADLVLIQCAFPVRLGSSISDEGPNNVREFEDQRRFPAVHPRFETTVIVRDRFGS